MGVGDTVMLPVGTSVGIPGVTPCAPRVGRAELGSTSQPPLAAGQLGVERFMLATYAEEGVPVGVMVAHWACKLLKSGCTGVGVPSRTNLVRVSWIRWTLRNGEAVSSYP